MTDRIRTASATLLDVASDLWSMTDDIAIAVDSYGDDGTENRECEADLCDAIKALDVARAALARAQARNIGEWV